MKYYLILIILVINTKLQFAQETWNWGNYGDSTFFPITTWLQNTAFIVQYQEAGFNVYQGFWGGIKETQITDLREKKMHYITGWNKTGNEDSPDLVARANIDDSLFIAWIQRDEPDNAQPDGQGGYGACIDPQSILDMYNEIKNYDYTGRQVLLNCGAGVARIDAYIRGDSCGGNTDMYSDYYSGCDIASFDIYPVSSPPSPMTTNDELWYVGQGVKNMREWTDDGKDAYWFALECTDIKGEGKITSDQMWIEAWMGIIAGGTAIQWFPFTVFPNVHNPLALLQDSVMLASVSKVNKAVHDLAITINSETLNDVVDLELAESPIFATPVVYMVKHWRDTLYIFSAGMRDYGSNTATFTINTVDGSDIISNAIELHEDREIEIVNNQFSLNYEGQSIHLFKIGGIAKDMIVSINDNPPQVVNEFSLEQNYPNPFNPSTTIKYQIQQNVKRQTIDVKREMESGIIPSRKLSGEGVNVQLKIYDILGKEVVTLVNEVKQPGKYSVNWNGQDTFGKKVSSGIYFYQLKTMEYFKTRKMVLLQ